MKNFLYRIFCGFFLGISIFAPGVSGSVMAVMMGIYTKLLDIVSNPFKNFKKNIIYLFPMGIGMLLSLVLFVVLFSYLFETYKKATYLLFMGLIAGNLPVIFKDAMAGGFKKRYIIGILTAFSVAVTLGILRLSAPQMQDFEKISLVFVGLCGALGGASGMVPGMSVSMVLMVPGIYDYILHSAKIIDVPVLLVFGACFAVGMVVFSRFTKYIFKKYHGFAYSMVFGFICGSFVSIYMGLPKHDPNFNWLIGVMALALGLVISLLFVYLSKKFNLDDDSKEDAQLAENSQEN
ncbi:MAG: DUF368 domain-containing protein [Clostridiales bacterium]|nr:DUF368 domain-containing protein [Clostridiales bacterium]